MGKSDNKKNGSSMLYITIILGFIILGFFYYFTQTSKQASSEKESSNGVNREEVTIENTEEEEFDREAAIEELSETVYYDCYDEIIKLNPTRTSREDLEYFREVCKLQQRDYELSLEESLEDYGDSFLEYLLTPEGRKSMREIQEDKE
jgi:hypothetical protein